jgi:hypothetical protein
MQYLFVAENYNPAITESALRVLKEEAYNLQASSVITPASTEPEKAFAEAWNGQLCIVHPPSWSAASLQNRERLSRHDRDILEKATYQQIAIAEEHGDKALSDETLMTLFIDSAQCRGFGDLGWGESKGRVKESLDYAKQYSLHIRWVDARYNQVTLNGWSPPAQLGLLLNQMKTS